ncbi:MAG: electron transfer flavoprotein subunit alpha, partial [Candidatus Bathyarchaeum sp.]
MSKIFVLAEHRRGELREITFEMLTKGKELAEKAGAELTAVLLGNNVGEYAKTLAEYAKKVLLVQDAKLENFNSEAYQKALSNLIQEHSPILILMGHTSFGVDLAPSLAVSM